jgi:hypothetical protein
MNIIINGFHNRSHFKVIAKICNIFGVKYFAHVYSGEIYPFPKNIKTDLFDWEEVLYLADYGLDLEPLTPIDEELISKMRECEAVAMNMMDRMEKYCNYPYSKRREIYLKHLKVWNHIISSKRIELFITSNVPHLVHDYIIYELCRLKNVPVIILKQSRIEGYFFIFNNWKILSPGLKEKYNRCLKRGNIKLSPDFDKHFLCHAGQQDTTPFYMKKPPLGRKLSKWLQSVFKEKNWRRRLRFGFGKLLTAVEISLTTRILMNYYEGISQEVDLEKKYIYLPLHFQPEMTTMPCAGAFSDQRLIVDLLSSVLPRGYYIYVKENPKQTSMTRSREYYRQIGKYRNVRFVSRRTSTFKLIKHCQAVATATGTAGWEALFRGKPVLMFGYDFYQYAPGVFWIKTVEDAKDAINSIKNKKCIPTATQIKAFLKAVESVSVPGYVDESYRCVSDLSLEKNEENLLKAISGYMKKVGFKYD